MLPTRPDMRKMEALAVPTMQEVHQPTMKTLKIATTTTTTTTTNQIDVHPGAKWPELMTKPKEANVGFSTFSATPPPASPMTPPTPLATTQAKAEAAAEEEEEEDIEQDQEEPQQRLTEEIPEREAFEMARSEDSSCSLTVYSSCSTSSSSSSSSSSGSSSNSSWRSSLSSFNPSSSSPVKDTTSDSQSQSEGETPSDAPEKQQLWPPVAGSRADDSDDDGSSDHALHVAASFDRTRWLQALAYSHALIAKIPKSHTVQEELDDASTATAAAANVTISQSSRMHHSKPRLRKRCVKPDCHRNAVSKGKCRTHGGGKQCVFANCSRVAITKSVYCWTHCGGRRCEFTGCTRLKNTKHSIRFCSVHLVHERAGSQEEEEEGSSGAVGSMPMSVAVTACGSSNGPRDLSELVDATAPTSASVLAAEAEAVQPMGHSMLPSLELARRVVERCSLHQFYRQVQRC